MTDTIVRNSESEQKELKSAPSPIVEGRALEKFYSQPDGHRIEVIAPTDLAIYPDQIVALLGPSGSGKSTLLRILTGLAPPSAGEVLWHGRPLDGQAPGVAIVFQSFALFPWLTVLENVEAPLKARGVSLAERRERAMKILDTVGLDGFEIAYPKELSGGMKQRVGFARALVVEPEVLFMDEPFSALDVLTAENLRGELMELWLNKKMPTRAIFIVTHNIEEAVLLADRVIVLGRNPARIRADFSVELRRPRDRKSERFISLVSVSKQAYSMFRREIERLFLYLARRSWRLLLRRSWRHARASLRIYRALAEREPHAALRAALLQLAANQERHAARKAERMRRLCMSLPEDRDTLSARVLRRLLVLCGSRWALAWIDKIEDFYLALSWEVMWLTMKVAARRAKLSH